jgi:hypothetical protein
MLRGHRPHPKEWRREKLEQLCVEITDTLSLLREVVSDECISNNTKLLRFEQYTAQMAADIVQLLDEERDFIDTRTGVALGD